MPVIFRGIGLNRKTRLALRERHRQRPFERLRHLRQIERIDDERARQLLCRSGELRQHEHPRIGRVLRRHILFRHQIHAVAQRRNEADLCRSEQRRQRVALILPMDVADRRPVELGEFAIDASGLGF